MRFSFQKVPRHGGSKPGDVVGAWTCVRATNDQPSASSPDWRSNVARDDAWDSMEGAAGRDGRDSDVPGPPGRDSTVPGPPGEPLNPRGEYRPGRTYKRLDLVRVPDEGSFVCVVDQTATEPSEHNRHWQTIALDGESIVGPAGPRGMPAPAPFSSNTAKATFDSAVVRGNVVRVSGTNRVDLALAHGSDAASLAVGLANGAYGPSGQGSYTVSGPFTNEAWNFTPGECLYLSPTVPGGVTNVFPNTIGDRVIILGMMLTPTTINLKIHWALIIGS